MTVRGVSAAEIIASLERDGFQHIDEAPRTPGLRVGARVHNAGERYVEAYTHGTATVLAVLRRGTDEKPDLWEKQWGRPNVEVVVQRDRDEPPTCWADYGTHLASEQP